MEKILIRLSLALISLAYTISAPAQSIYKCIDDNGKTTFSQRPCADNAEKVTVKDHNSGISVGPSGDFSKMRDGNKSRQLERRIQILEDEIDLLHSSRDRDLAALRRKKRYANNNLAGATWEQSISTEMQSITASYAQRIESRRDEISQLRSELKDLDYEQ